MDRLLAGGRDVRLWTAGEGVEKDALSPLIAERGRGVRLRLLGYRADPTDWYEASDVFALNSSRKGTPNVLLEAMAREVPAIATAVNGVSRMVTDGETGTSRPADGWWKRGSVLRPEWVSWPARMRDGSR